MANKKEFLPYELRLGSEYDVHDEPEQDNTPTESFDEAAEMQKILALNKEIAQERKKPRPDTVLIARNQCKITLIREAIMNHNMRRTK